MYRAHAPEFSPLRLDLDNELKPRLFGEDDTSSPGFCSDANSTSGAVSCGSSCSVSPVHGKQLILNSHMSCTEHSAAVQRDFTLLKSKYEIVVAENAKQESILKILEEKLEAASKTIRQLENEVRTQFQETGALQYENTQLKGCLQDLQLIGTDGNTRTQKLVQENTAMREELHAKDEQHRRLLAKYAKLDEEYIRLEELCLADPAECFGPQSVSGRLVKSSRRPRSPTGNRFANYQDVDEHECINPGYSENCAVSNESIAVTARQFASFQPGSIPSNLDKALDRELENSKPQDTSSASASWWSKSKTKKASKWTDMPSLPGDVSNVCAATEHNGRFYVAMTVNGPSMSTIDKTPTQVLQLCYLQKRQWYVMDVESPPDARYATALVSHGGKLFLVTAQSGGDSIWILNQHNRWEFVTATVNGEVASAACLVGDQIVMAGGSMNDEHGTSFSFVKSFCISSSTWNHGWPLLRHARNSARLVLMGNTLCVFGGLAGSRRKGFETVQYEERLSLSNISAGWTSVKISKAFGSGVLGTATRIVSAGGLERRDFAITGAVTCQYLRQDGQFANGVLPSLATKRSTPCLVEFKGSLYCIGGCLDKAGFCGVVEELVLE